MLLSYAACCMVPVTSCMSHIALAHVNVGYHISHSMCCRSWFCIFMLHVISHVTIVHHISISHVMPQFTLTCHIPHATYSMLHMIYDMMCVGCYLSHGPCHILHITRHLWHVQCHMSHVTNCMPQIACHVLHVTDQMSHRTCFTWHATCDMAHVACCMPHVTCCMLYATCQVPHIACHLWISHVSGCIYIIRQLDVGYVNHASEMVSISFRVRGMGHFDVGCVYRISRGTIWVKLALRWTDC